MSTTIDARMISVLMAERASAGHGFWEALADGTGVTSKRWRNLYSRSQRATPDMVEALARRYPQYAFWLVTGITDAINGHVAPPKVETFPERPAAEVPADGAYFLASLGLLDRLCDEGLSSVDDEQRVLAFERKHWIPWKHSVYVQAVESLVNSDVYQELMHLWRAREDHREERVRKNNQAAWDHRHCPPNFGPEGGDSRLGEWEVFYRGRDDERTFELLPAGDAKTAKRFPHYMDYAIHRDFAVAMMEDPPDRWSEEDLIRTKLWLRRMEGPVAWQFAGWLVQQGLFPDGVQRLPFSEEDVDRVEVLVRKRFGLDDDNQAR